MSSTVTGRMLNLLEGNAAFFNKLSDYLKSVGRDRYEKAKAASTILKLFKTVQEVETFHAMHRSLAQKLQAAYKSKVSDRWSDALDTQVDFVISDGEDAYNKVLADISLLAKYPKPKSDRWFDPYEVFELRKIIAEGGSALTKAVFAAADWADYSKYESTTVKQHGDAIKAAAKDAPKELAAEANKLAALYFDLADARVKLGAATKALFDKTKG